MAKRVWTGEQREKADETKRLKKANKVKLSFNRCELENYDFGWVVITGEKLTHKSYYGGLKEALGCKLVTDEADKERLQQAMLVLHKAFEHMKEPIAKIGEKMKAMFQTDRNNYITINTIDYDIEQYAYGWTLKTGNNRNSSAHHGKKMAKLLSCKLFVELNMHGDTLEELVVNMVGDWSDRVADLGQRIDALYVEYGIENVIEVEHVDA